MWRFSSAACEHRAIDVSPPRQVLTNGRDRVEACVDGRRIWFEASDATLSPANEAYGAALLVPALHAGRTLRMAGPACQVWADQLARLTDACRGLWYADAPRPLVVPHGNPTLAATDQDAASGQAALCFSGGVDAFYTLLAGGMPIDRIVYVVGYDVSLRERRRATAVSSLLRDVASEVACASTVITTNLRRHPLVRNTPWLRAFGGALAAIGHLLAPVNHRMLLSSDGLGFEHPEVGSRPSIDPLHGSATVAVEHVAPVVTRLEKVRVIAGEPIVQRHLRVCWKNVGSRMNCGRCEKCIRTMLALDACGMLGRFPGFDHGRGLLRAIDALPAVDGVVVSFYRELLGRGLTPATSAAVGRLLERTTVPETRRKPSVRLPGGFRHRLLDPTVFADVCQPLVGKKVGYVRPEGNVGDRLIEVAMIQLFAEHGIRWRLWRPDVAGDAEGLDLLVFGGGGNMGTRYPGNHELRGRALATGLPVLILPQSFTSAEDRPYAKVFVREQGSLVLRPDGMLAPDLALGLATPPPQAPRHMLGIFLRRDQERTGRKPLLFRDPIRLRRDPLAYLALAARYRRIVTDRLHFAIAGLHAGRDVTLVANDYHKNRSMHETWLADLGCRFVASAAEAWGRRAA